MHVLEASDIMTVLICKAAGRSNDVDKQAQNRVRDAADRLYAAECAWHDAHQSHVDAWTLAASERLNDAIAIHLAAVAAFTGSATNRRPSGRLRSAGNRA